MLYQVYKCTCAQGARSNPPSLFLSKIVGAEKSRLGHFLRRPSKYQLILKFTPVFTLYFVVIFFTDYLVTKLIEIRKEKEKEQAKKSKLFFRDLAK